MTNERHDPPVSEPHWQCDRIEQDTLADSLMTALKSKVANFFPVAIGESFQAYAGRAVANNLTSGQRAMIAACAVSASKKVCSENQKHKSKWIRAARLEFNQSLRQACAICGKYRGVSQAHHTFPLSLQYDCNVREPNHEHDWLCPTHHTAIHVVIDALVANRQPKLDGIPPEERDAIARLVVKFVNFWAAAQPSAEGKRSISIHRRPSYSDVAALRS
jgi:hypothetical protein